MQLQREWEADQARKAYVADMAAFQAVMDSEAGAEAMKYDGVRPETIAVYTEG